MANWITHMMIVDRLLDMGLDLDVRGFVVGNVAPDCNVENADWSAFTPSREVTHWMTAVSEKQTADYNGFYDKYIRGREFASEEEKAFFIGYYCHLIADVQHQLYFYTPEMVAARFERIRKNPEYAARVAGLPENSQTIRRAFTRQEKLGDQVGIEREYLRRRPDSVYNTVLRNVTEFPDYIDYLPAGAIARKIPIMIAGDMAAAETKGYVFITPEEHGRYVADTAELIFEKITCRSQG